MEGYAQIFHHRLKKERDWEKWLPHIEMAMALISGILIGCGWLLDKAGMEKLSVIAFLSAFAIGGFFKAKEGIENTIKDKDLNVEMLMVFAAIGSAIIGYWMEGALLIFIFAVSGALESYTMSKSKKELNALMSVVPEEATLLENGVERVVPVRLLRVGNVILVKPGERIPADGVVKTGFSSVDESPITGESIPVSKKEGDGVFAGTVNGAGAITVEITKPASETLFQRIIELIQNAQEEKSPAQAFIERFEGIYVKGVIAVVAVMMFLPHYLFGWSWTETFYRSMILLVVASPCALVASITPATLAAISNGARKGILFKGGVHLEILGNIKTVAFDKTGTLTKGKPELTDIIVDKDWPEEKVLEIAASVESRSTHPLARSIVRFAKDKGILSFLPVNELEDISGYGVQAKINNETWRLGKWELMENKNGEWLKKAETFRSEGKSIVFMENGEKIVALFALKDVVRNEAKKAIRDLHRMGIHTVMITGDNEETARSIADEIGIRQVAAKCLPHEKVNVVKKLLETSAPAAMVGDGINDGPALASANVGIAMGEGTDVALETADIVLMKNDLTKIADAIRLSKRMNRIVKENIFFSIAVIVLLIASNFLQAISLPLGVIGHEGSTILVILNGLRLLRG